jgi:hypothetical protein
MHYKGAGLAVLFLGDNTLTIQMPMVIDGKCAERGSKPTDEQLEPFDINKWTETKVKTTTKTTSKAKKVHSRVGSAVHAVHLDLAEQLRQALLKRLAA